MNRVYLTRKIDETHIRYYKMEFFVNLFGDILFEKIYGNVSYKKPTRHIKVYYSSLVDAKDMFFSVLKQKIKKGYMPQSRIEIK